MLLLLAAVSCNPSENTGSFTATGTVRYLGVDAGCWQIINDDGEALTPMNLGEHFQIPDLRVWIEAKYRNDLDPACMSGYVVELIDIHEV
jgi:hypothetical protein